MEVIKVEKLTKIYDLGLVGTGTLSKDLNRMWAKILGKTDPYATIAQLNDRTQKSNSSAVYALKDINFSVRQGEVVGIIGKNGAGKSTLLKILSQITGPSTGNIKIKGRVASLLEVGTGMHPEMTARQNIYLNGSIMGMRRHEITSKLDEIIDFAGIAKYVDTPIKRFSSGMQVRLGFAVAAFLEPEILIVDEVLAVGDAEFQKKAIGKMKDVSNSEGRTVLFVSHNMAAVKSLCTRGIQIRNGMITSNGSVDRIISDYLIDGSELGNYKELNYLVANFNLISIGVRNVGKSYDDPIVTNEKIEIDFIFKNNSKQRIHFTIKMKGEDGQYCMTTSSPTDEIFITKNTTRASMIFPEYLLNEGNFYLDILVVQDLNHPFIWEKDLICFQVNPEEKKIGNSFSREQGYFIGKFEWMRQ
jgi:lipopolysaccharide transport system ATP-binding protein